MEIGVENKRLRKIRKVLGYSQADFAKSLGLTQGGYSDIERGKNGVSNRIKKILINLFKININYLENEQGEMFYIDTPQDLPEVVNTTVSQLEALDTKDTQIQLLKAEIRRLNSERDLYLQLIETKDKTIKALERQINN
ncbi:XRE family transcriptional regulator [bacterium]|nr:MAG: XRE family transcriptional regulator [bacterium]